MELTVQLVIETRPKLQKKPTQENWPAAVRLTVSELPLHFARHVSLCRCICDHFFKGRASNSGSLPQSLVLTQWLMPQGAEGHCSSATGLGSAITHLKNTHLQLSVWFFVSFPHYHFSALLNPRAFTQTYVSSCCLQSPFKCAQPLCWAKALP